MQAITELLYKHFDKPALVIGGGPSVLADLPFLPEDYFDAVFSANEHGFKQTKFLVNYTVNVDKRHSVTQEYMRHRLRQYHAAIINCHSWADYRLPDWKWAVNSGITAIAAAVVMGCNPIVTTGIDCWQTNQLYFHTAGDPGVRSAAQKFRPYFMEQLAHLVRSREGCYGNVRALSGLIKDRFGVFHVDEHTPVSELHPHPYRLELLARKMVRIKVLRSFAFSPHDTVMAGTVLTVSPRELHRIAPRGAIEVLQD